MTPDGVMKTLRNSRGGLNSALYFQAFLESFFGQLSGNLLACIEDFALYTRRKHLF